MTKKGNNVMDWLDEIADNVNGGEKRHLPNTEETWRRIGNRDSFAELNFTSDQERNDFLKEWKENNNYNTETDELPF